jgi:hypothetical protein
MFNRFRDRGSSGLSKESIDKLLNIAQISEGDKAIAALGKLMQNGEAGIVFEIFKNFAIYRKNDMYKNIAYRSLANVINENYNRLNLEQQAEFNSILNK